MDLRGREDRVLRRLSVAILWFGLLTSVVALAQAMIARRRWDAELSLLLAFILLFAALLIDELRSKWHRQP